MWSGSFYKELAMPKYDMTIDLEATFTKYSDSFYKRFGKYVLCIWRSAGESYKIPINNCEHFFIDIRLHCNNHVTGTIIDAGFIDKVRPPIDFGHYTWSELHGVAADNAPKKVLVETMNKLEELAEKENNETKEQ